MSKTIELYDFVNNFYTVDDAVSMVTQIRAIVSKYKFEKHTLSRFEIQDMMDDLAVLRNQLADIGADIRQYCLEVEDEHKEAKNIAHDEIEMSLRADRVPGAEDKAKRRAEVETHHIKIKLSKAKGVDSLITSHVKTLEQVLFGMNRRISLLLADPSENSKSAKDVGHEEDDMYNLYLSAEKEAQNIENELEGI